MRVRILTSIAGSGFSYRRGQIVSLDDATAREWVSLGMAAPEAAPASTMKPVAESETAEAPSYETTDRPANRRRRRR